MRNRALEAKLLADPDDEATRAVFADWLQANGDPWGELIALRTARKARAANRLFEKHVESFTGGHEHAMVWRDGFIDTIRIGDAQTLTEVLALRTALLVRRVVAPFKLDPDDVKVLNKRATSVRRMFTWLSYPVSRLTLPNLEHLTLHGTHGVVLLDDVLARMKLPKLRRLEIYNRHVDAPIIEALLDSKLCAQLEWLDLQGALDADGIELIKRRKRDVARIPVLALSYELDPLFPKQKAAWEARVVDES